MTQISTVTPTRIETLQFQYTKNIIYDNVFHIILYFYLYKVNVGEHTYIQVW